MIDLYAAREMARRGDRDAAIPVMRNSVEAMFQERQLAYLIGATAVLVETLLGRTTEGAVAEAQSVIDRLADLPAEEDPVLRAVTLLRLRALLSRARGDDVAYRDFVNRYRAMAKSLGFEGHITMADAM